ncbi:MAG: hypothetical protein K2N50_04650 [Clostridia bacterium]|nr:hypothetical protein [Clostridia bacterium]
MEKNPVLQDDILRYKKNKFASGFALLALVFNCLYFALLYSILSTDLYKLQLGFSVIINLLVLLVGFYASEGIKGYNKKFSIVLLVLAAVQLIRIVYYPSIGAAKNWLSDSNYYFGAKMNNAANATVMIIYLVGSAACFIVSAVQGFIVARRLEVFQKKLDNGEVSVEAALKEIEEKEVSASVQNINADSNNEPSEVKEIVEAEEKTLSSGEADNG